MSTEERSLIHACTGCGALPGEYHIPGCDVEPCYCCGNQLKFCNMVSGYYMYAPAFPEDRIRWTGEWPGVVECREFGWYTPDGIEDLSRLRVDAHWDRKQKRFVKGRRGELELAQVDFEVSGFLQCFLMRVSGFHCEDRVISLSDQVRKWAVMRGRLHRRLKKLESKGWAISDENRQSAEEGLAVFLKQKNLFIE